MKIKMLMSIAGVGFALSRGDETERFSDGDAVSLILGGVAVPVAGDDYETSVIDRLGLETSVTALNLGIAGSQSETGGSADQGLTASDNSVVTGTDTTQLPETVAVTDAQVAENGAAAGISKPETGATKAETAPAQPASGKAKGKAD